jgi:AraC-like DNA-binding protein
MPVQIVTHTCPTVAHRDPTCERPVTMVARDLAAAEQLAPHQHPYGQLTLALDGILRVTALDSSWIVPPLRAIWIGPHVQHEITVLESARLRPIFILAERDPFIGSPGKVLEVSPLLRELVMALEQLDPAQVTPRATLIGQLILDELPRLETRPIRVPLPQDKRLRTLCDLLINTPGAPHTLEEWAGQVGASERTLARLFEKELQMGFGQWRQQVRLAHAATLIARGLPLSQVSDQLGYASQSAFTAMFRKTFGTTPSAFFK